MIDQKVSVPDIKKQTWGPGEWQDEPDQEVFEYRGYKCYLVRNNYGAWCGYIQIPADHEIIRESYGDIDIEVHGGVTYGQIGHWMFPDETGYFLGFDCAHYGDQVPFRLSDPAYKLMCPGLYESEIYKNIEFARNECKSMINQLIKEA